MASYIEQNLGRGEVIVCRAHVSWWSQLVLILIAIPLCFFFIGFLLLIVAILNVLTTELALTNKRVIAKFGFIRRHTIELRADKIESITVKQGILGRIFNFGSVVVCGTGGAQTPIPYIKGPQNFRKRVNDFLDEAESK